MSRRYFNALVCAFAVYAGSVTPRAVAADEGRWKIAPPPPASWQRDRLADLSPAERPLWTRLAIMEFGHRLRRRTAELCQRCGLALPAGE